MRTHFGFLIPLTVACILEVLAPQVFSQAESKPAQKEGTEDKPLAPVDDSAEKILRLAYGRLILYSKAGHGFDAAMGRAPYNPDDELRFSIQNIRTGPIEEILNRPYGQVVTKPTGYVLKVMPEARRLEKGPQHLSYKASWVQSDNKGTLLEDWERTTVREVLRLTRSRPADIDKTLHSK